MCGRFTRFHTWADIHQMYRLTDATETGRNTEARYNIAPTEDVLFVTAGDNGSHKLREGRWWLVPWWAKELPKQPMFNARIETADTTGAFKDAWKSKRCLVPPTASTSGRRTPRTAAAIRGSSTSRERAILVCRPLGAQRQARRDELHDHHHAGRGADEPAPRPPAGDTRARCL